MKNRTSLLLCILAAALLLGGCAAVNETPAPASPAPTSAPSPAPTPSPVPTPTHPPEQFPYDYAETLAETEDFSASVTALGVDWENNWVVHLRLENRSKEIMNFRFLYQSVNGLAIEDSFTYRVAIGAVAEPSFRILREELAAWGEERPVQWGFTLRVSSAESNRPPYFLEELAASPFGEENAVRCEYTPAKSDFVVMDNDYAAVYINGWQLEDGELRIDYVAVNRCGRPLALVLAEEELLLDGEGYAAALRDSFGAWATLYGYIPVPDWPGDAPPRALELRLALVDLSAPDEPVLEDSESFASLNAR